jgi:hypothetical protein
MFEGDERMEGGMEIVIGGRKKNLRTRGVVESVFTSTVDV